MSRIKVASSNIDSLSTKSSKRFKRRSRRKPDYTAFVIGDPKTPASLAIDAKLVQIFQELNQTESWQFHSPYRDFLAEKIHESRLDSNQSLSIGASPTNWTVTLTRSKP